MRRQLVGALFEFLNEKKDRKLLHLSVVKVPVLLSLGFVNLLKVEKSVQELEWIMLE